MHDVAPNVKYLCTDMPDITLQGIKDGKIYATLGHDTYTQEFWGIVLAYYAYHGLTIPEDVTIHGLVITTDNVNEYLP